MLSRFHGHRHLFRCFCTTHSAEATLPDVLKEYGLTKLPPMPPKGGLYKRTLIVGDLVYVSGHGPLLESGKAIQGVVGESMTTKEGKSAAAQTAFNVLATLRHELGSLNRIKRVVKTLGMVNSTATFEHHPQVINGYSEVMQKVFGEDNGVGTRSAVGMGSLPARYATEVEGIFQLHDNE